MMLRRCIFGKQGQGGARVEGSCGVLDLTERGAEMAREGIMRGYRDGVVVVTEQA